MLSVHLVASLPGRPAAWLSLVSTTVKSQACTHLVSLACVPLCSGKYELVTSADFSERLKLEFNHEVQPMHWSSTTCSIYVVIVYLPPSPGYTEKRVESFFFVSDEPKQVCRGWIQCGMASYVIHVWNLYEIRFCHEGA